MKIGKYTIRWNRVFGLALIWLGLFIILSSPIKNITGFVVAESISSFGGWSYLIGLGMILIGIILMQSDVGTIAEEIEERMDRKAQSERVFKAGLRNKKPLGQGPNKQARYYFREMYKREYKRTPSDEELREYMRRPHEDRAINEKIEEYVHQKKRGFSE